MSANTFTLEAAAAANIQVVGSDKGSQAVHDLIVAYQAEPPHRFRQFQDPRRSQRQ